MIAGPTSGTQLRCPKCKLALDAGSVASVAGVADIACPACRSTLTIRLFPAFTHQPQTISTATGERALEGEAVCFFHPEKRASVACERCGRFLCALCDVPFGGKHLCPSCLDSSKLPELTNRRLVWGQLAFTLGALPLILACLYPFYVITGPAAIFVALWKWKAPGSLVRGPRRGLAILGIVCGVIQLGVIGAIVFGIFQAFRHG